MKDQQARREANSCGIAQAKPEILLDYCSGTLDAAEAAEFSRHVAECPACQGVVNEQGHVWDLLDHWTPDEITPDFDRRLYARIAEEQATSSWTKLWLRIFHPADPQSLWKPALSLAAACGVIAISLWVRTPPSTLVRTPAFVDYLKTDNLKQVRGATQVSGESINIQQVESALEDLDILTPVS